MTQVLEKETKEKTYGFRINPQYNEANGFLPIELWDEDNEELVANSGYPLHITDRKKRLPPNFDVYGYFSTGNFYNVWFKPIAEHLHIPKEKWEPMLKKLAEKVKKYQSNPMIYKYPD